MNTCDATMDCRSRHTAPYRLFLRIGQLLEVLRCRHEQARLRRELAGMPDYLLKDMGITRDDLHRECRKPIWRP